jgi:hypothetical protein
MVLADLHYRSALGAGLMALGPYSAIRARLRVWAEHAEGDRCVVFWYEPEYLRN